MLTGGAGADIFIFQSASDGPDEITDFVSGIDQIQVSASGFGGGLTAGGTVSLVSGADPTASGAAGQFLFDTDDGKPVLGRRRKREAAPRCSSRRSATSRR